MNKKIEKKNMIIFGSLLILFLITFSPQLNMFVNEENLNLLKNSGCKFINYGFESMNEIVLKEIKNIPC